MSWEDLHDMLADRGHRVPIVIQYNKRDVPDAVAVEDLQRDLGVQPFRELAGSPVANPGAMLVNAHIEAVASQGTGVEETLTAALDALDEGIVAGENVAALGMKQVDAVIKEKLTDALGDVPGIGGLIDDMLAQGGGPDAMHALEQAMMEHAQRQLIEMLDDEEMREKMLAQHVAQLGAFDTVDARLPCPDCGHVVSSIPIYLRPDSDGSHFAVGDAIAVPDDVREDYYIRIREVEPDAPFDVLEVYECEECGGMCWCRLSFADGALHAVWPAAFNRATVFGSSIVASDVVRVAAELADVDPQLLTADEALAILEEYFDVDGAD